MTKPELLELDLSEQSLEIIDNAVLERLKHKIVLNEDDEVLYQDYLRENTETHNGDVTLSVFHSLRMVERNKFLVELLLGYIESCENSNEDSGDYSNCSD